MKHILTILFLFTALATSGRQATSSLKFDATVHNFGTIDEQKGAVKCKFTFTNNSKTPIVIESIETSCGCTTPSYSREPVKPGKKGEITISFDPTGRPGAFSKDIIVRSGNGTNYDKLLIRGTVTPRPRTVADDYPLELFGGIRLTGVYVNFDRVGQGTAKSMTLGYINIGKKSVNLQVKTDTKASHFKVTSPGAVCAGCKGEITFTYDLTRGEIWGMQTNEATIYIDGKKVEVPVTTVALLVDDFSKTNNETAPKAKFNSLFHHFGDVSRNGTLEKTFTIENEGRSALIVRHITCSKGMTTTLKSGTTIAAGKTMTFKVALKPDDTEGNRKVGGVTIIFNDPVRPMREVRVVANITEQ